MHTCLTCSLYVVLYIRTPGAEYRSQEAFDYLVLWFHGFSCNRGIRANIVFSSNRTETKVEDLINREFCFRFLASFLLPWALHHHQKAASVQYYPRLSSRLFDLKRPQCLDCHFMAACTRMGDHTVARIVTTLIKPTKWLPSRPLHRSSGQSIDQLKPAPNLLLRFRAPSVALPHMKEITLFSSTPSSLLHLPLLKPSLSPGVTPCPSFQQMEGLKLIVNINLGGVVPPARNVSGRPTGIEHP